MDWIHPPRLHPGDRVQVVAASGPVKPERFEAGARVLEGRYRLTWDDDALFARTGFLAGDDQIRLRALNAAIADPQCRAVFLARGGYGLTRILPRIDRLSLRSHPKPIVGYSDVTALLATCYQAKVTAVHGPMVSDLATLSEPDRDSLFNLLENPAPGLLMRDLETWVDGRASGPLLGGNLEILTRLLGTPAQPDFTGAILFIEEVGELPYRVDRLLTHLEMAGIFDRIAGIVVGDFTDCDETDRPEEQTPSCREVLLERLRRLHIPIAANGGFGHGRRKASLPCGSRAELDATSGELRALEGAVS